MRLEAHHFVPCGGVLGRLDTGLSLRHDGGISTRISPAAVTSSLVVIPDRPARPGCRSVGMLIPPLPPPPAPPDKMEVPKKTGDKGATGGREGAEME